MTIRAMLAAQFDERRILAHLEAVGFLWFQPKIDGMRVLGGPDAVPLSRSGKEWKQKHLRALFRERPSLRGFDGEVIAGHVYDPTVFRDSMSGIRAEDGSPEFTYYVFDNFSDRCAPYGYSYRLAKIREILDICEDDPNQFIRVQGGEGYDAKIVLCPTYRCTTLDEIYRREEEAIAAGWEGGILRRDDRPYKFNRATPLDGSLTKLKRFEDAEAIVVGYEAWEVNENEAELSELGYTVRSQHQDGKRVIDRLGCLHVELLTDRSIKFKVGVFKGWDHAMRDRLWAARTTLPGRILKFKHQGYGGGYDKPRTPVGLGWRSAIDL